MMTAPVKADEERISESGIDHLLYASASLERGMDEIESLLGVRPVRGGRHPKYGTHNALLSLGPGVYLEIIARDPELPVPSRGLFIGTLPDDESRLLTWVYRTTDIANARSSLEDAGVSLGAVESGSRTKPDGSKVSWQATDPYPLPLDGAIPFLIDWGNTVHPSTAVPSGGQLVEVVIEHPDPDQVRNALSALNVEINVVEGSEYRLEATIATPDGHVTLR